MLDQNPTRARAKGGPNVRRKPASSPRAKRRPRPRAREEHLRLAQRALGMVTWVWDMKRDHMQWYGNPAKVFGIPRRAFAGRFGDYLRYLHPEDAAHAAETYMACVKGLRPEYRSERRFVARDGSVRWLETYGRASYDRKGRAIRMTGVATDITSRKELESAHGKAEQKFTRTFESVAMPMVLSRRRDGVIVALNEAWERVNAISRERALGKAGIHTGHWTDLDARARIVAQVDACGRAEEQLVHFDLPGGGGRDALVSCVQIEFDGEAHLLWSSIDVTELKRSEHRERQARVKYSALFDTSPEAVAILRLRDGKLQEVNAAWERNTGRKREQVVGLSSDDFVFWSDRAHRAAAIERLNSSGCLGNYETRFVRADGSEFDVLLSGARIEIDGEACAIWSWRDVSDLRAAELRASQSLTKFAALFETNPDGIVVTRVDRSGERIVEINDAALKVIRATRAEAIGAEPMAIMRWLDEPAEKEFRARLRAGERLVDQHQRLERRDGTVMEMRFSAGIVEFDGWRHVMVSFQDVSAQLRQQRELAESEERFEKAFQASQEAIGMSRLSDSRMVAVNPRFEQLYGAAAADIVGKTSSEIGIWDSNALLRDRIKATLSGERRIRDWELPFRNRDGEPRRVLYNAEVIEVGGEPHVIAFLRDVTMQRRTEEQARQAERKFSALFESSPEAITLLRVSDNCRLAANAAWERITGFHRDKAVGNSALANSLFPDPAQRARLVERAVTEGRVSNVEMRLKRADGSNLNALMSGERIDLEGEVCVLWCWRDVTVERAAERASRLSDARYRALFESSIDGMLIRDADGVILEVNRAACSHFGHPAEELVGHDAAEFVSPQALAASPLRTDATVRWGRVERALRRKDGREVATEIVSGPLPDGTVLAILRDISERKRSEALVMSIARGVSSEVGGVFFRSLVEHLARDLGGDIAFIGAVAGSGRDHIRTIAFTADGVVAPNFEYALAESPCAAAFEKRGTAVYAERVAELFPQDAALARLGVQGYVGTTLFGADGTALGILVVMSRKPIDRPGLWSSMIEIFGARAAAEIERSRSDTMVRKLNASLERRVKERTLELEEANLDLDSYNYSVSHDLRQPLNAIAGFSELLRENLLASGSAETIDYAREIESNAGRMERMIEALLEFARTGRGTLNKVRVDIRSQVESVAREFTAGGRRRVEIVVGDLPTAQGDEELLRQVWSNLIGNAVKYSARRRSPRVEIGGERCGNNVTYTVRDNGVGFDMKYAERLFGVFQRMPNSESYDGTGVGLAIVQRIVRRHGGRVSADSSPGKGATIRFTLPA